MLLHSRLSLALQNTPRVICVLSKNLHIISGVRILYKGNKCASGLENRHTYKCEGSIKVLWSSFPLWKKTPHVKCDCQLRKIAVWLLHTNTDILIEFLIRKLFQSPHSPGYNPSDAAVAMVTAVSTF